MKKTVLIFVLFLLSASIFAQYHRGRRQQSIRVNVSISPYVEYIKVADNMNLAAGMSLTTTINESFFYGFILTKKLQKNYINYGENGGELDISHQHFGAVIGGYINLGIYRGRGGRYRKRSTKFMYSMSMSNAAFWLVDKGSVKIGSREYFFIAQPTIGILRKVGKFIDVEGGLRYPIALRIDAGWEDPYNITTKEFTGPGVYLAIKFNFFR